jgi:PleD family two-component response regulator
VKGRVLIIEDRDDNRMLLREQFEQDEIEVIEAETGEAGLEKALRAIPQVIVLSTSLPNVSGLEIAERLRDINRTKHVFLMMMGDEENRKERLTALEAGANDFVTIPVDPDLVALRVRNAIQRANSENTTDPVTGMPAGRRVQTELMRLVRDDPEGDWALMRFHVRNLDPFREVHGFMAGDDILRATARLLAEALGQESVEEDFMGFGGHDDFIVITDADRADELREDAQAAFEGAVGSFYDFLEREQGTIEFEGKQYPLARLTVHTVVSEDGPFYDIRSLTEVLAG